MAYLGVAAIPAQAATPSVYQGHAYPTYTAATADKPQSKVWYNAGWWALMVTPAGAINIYKLQADHTWKDTGTLVHSKGTGDALWSGGKLYVVNRTAGTSGAVEVHRFSYSNGVYTEDTAFKKTFPGGGTESATIDKDATGKLWVTFTRGSAVWVMATTDSTQTTWTSPFRISGADTTVSDDDISAVIAFDDKIGVLWSDQESNAMRFAYHLNGAASTSWTVETVLSGSGLADDHINIKSLMGDDSGRIYAAVKTSKTVSSDPSLYVVTRTAGGTWSASQTASVADGLTRPQLALDKTNKIMYVMQSTEGGGTVYYKSAPLSDRPSFATGKGAPFIAWSGAKINNVSTTKDPVTSTTGLVAIASDEFARRYYHAELALGSATDTTPPPAPAVTPSSGSYSSAQSVSMSNSESGVVIRYTVGSGTTVPADPTSSSTAYTGPLTVSSSQIIKARAFDAAGNASLVTRRDYTFSSSTTTRTVTLNPVADTMVKQGSATSNFGAATPLQADSQDVSGTSSAVHSYLRFTIPTLATGESITAANLSLNVSNGTANGPAVYRTGVTWSETSMTWNSGRPARSSTTPVGNYGSVPITRVSTPLTGISSAGEVSLELAPEATDGMDFGSREATATSQPQLILTIAS